MAAISRSVTWRGCGLAKRIRSMPGTSLTRASNSGEVARRIVRRLVVIHDLAEQLHLDVAASRLPRGPRRGCRRPGRMRSWPRVYGTTQNAQNSLQPSMIVTQARTGSDGLATPSGNETSSCGSMSMRGVRACAPRRATSARQLLQALRADDDVDARSRARAARAFLLRHATGDGDDRRRAGRCGGLADFAEPRIAASLRRSRARCRC